MRWKVKMLKPVDINNTRVVRKFLFLPRCINDEWRWLEMATIIQTVQVKYDTFGLGAIPYEAWVDYMWKD